MMQNRTWLRLSAAVLLSVASAATLAGPSASAHAKPPVKAATIKVGGKKTRVLEDSSGWTLYYFTKDTSKHSACTGSCRDLWPAYKVTSAPKTVSGLKGHFSVLKGQLEYQGHPLYTYRGDTGRGQSHGQGVLHEWYVATPKLASAKAPKKTGTGGGGGW